jgi:hypothetical protein
MDKAKFSQIKIILFRLLEALIDCQLSFLIPQKPWGDFGGEEDLGTIQPRPLNPLATGLLIAI